MIVRTLNEGTDFAPKIGDTRACLALRDTRLFSNTTNNFFCSVEREELLMNVFIKRMNLLWGKFNRPDLPHAKEGILQQAYSIMRCNEAIREYSLASDVKYKYKMRLRSDYAWLEPIPDVRTLNFSSSRVNCNSEIIITDYETFPGGNEDSFAFGLAEDMDMRMNHFNDLVLNQTIMEKVEKSWSNELHLKTSLEMRSICLQFNKKFKAVVVKPIDHIPVVFQSNTETGQANNGADWEDISDKVFPKEDEKKKIHIVFATHTESLGEWVRHIKYLRTIYHHRSTDDKNSLPNVGNECLAYIRYILDNFYSLPEIVVFLQGKAIDHCPTLNEVLHQDESEIEKMLEQGYYNGFHPLSNIHHHLDSDDTYIKDQLGDAWLIYGIH